MFKVFTCDTNTYVMSICFADSVGTECGEILEDAFSSVKPINGLDMARSTTIVEEEKLIDFSRMKVFTHAPWFRDPIHVKKNMLSHVGVQKAMDSRIYDRDCRALYQPLIARLWEEYGRRQKAYLERFVDEEHFRSF